MINFGTWGHLGKQSVNKNNRSIMSKTLVAKFVIFFSSTLMLASCGNGGDNKPATTGDTAATATAPSAATASSDIPHKKGLELIGASDCTTCHKVHLSDEGPGTGPAYDQVAAKYSPAADTTIDRLVKKIISGGTGVWGTIPMVGHPSLPPGDVKEMVQFIMSLKK
jgi:cytochrome c